MSIDTLIQVLLEKKEKWGDLDVRVKISPNDYVEPWLTVTKPANTSTQYIVIQ